MNQVSAAFDWVIVDSPSVNIYADSRHLATVVDGVILVVREGVTPKELAQKVWLRSTKPSSSVWFSTPALVLLMLNMTSPSIRTRFKGTRATRRGEAIERKTRRQGFDLSRRRVRSWRDTDLTIESGIGRCRASQPGVV